LPQVVGILTMLHSNELCDITFIRYAAQKEHRAEFEMNAITGFSFIMPQNGRKENGKMQRKRHSAKNMARQIRFAFYNTIKHRDVYVQFDY